MPESDEFRELRIRVEPSYHQRLLTLKVLKNKTMTDAVQEALDLYFAQMLPAPSRPAEDAPSGPSLPRPDGFTRL